MKYIQSYTHREIHSPEFFLKEQKAERTFPNWRRTAEETSAGWFRLLCSCLAEEGPGLRDLPWAASQQLCSTTELFHSSAVFTTMQYYH